MHYSINPEQRPFYLQIYQKLRADIINGTFSYNSKLPSKRLLAAETGLSTVTIEHAYALLCDEGYIESSERSGYFVIFRADNGFAASSSGHIIAHTSPRARNTQYPAFSIDILSKTMRRVLSDYREVLLEKSPNQGTAELRKALCEYLSRNRGIKVNPAQIIIGSGAEYLYRLIVELLGREHTIAIESPSYKKIEQVYRATLINYELLPLARDGIDSAALKATRADILHTSPYRSFPSGVTASASKRHEYLRWAEKHGRYIIEDDFESEFSVSAKPTETLFAASTDDNIIYLNTFSQTISPSLRVGYMVLPEKLVAPFQQKLGFYSCTVPTFEQYVLAELLQSGDFERHINRVRRLMRRNLAST